MLLDEVMKGRRSVRKWLNKAVGKNQILVLADAARYAPCSCNRQSIKLLVLQKREDIIFLGRKLSGGTGFAHNANILIVILVDIRSYDFIVEKYAPYLDGAAAIQNILLKAHESGLGAVWLNWVMNRNNEDKIFKKFNILPHLLPISAVAIGWPALVPSLPARKNVEELVVFDKF